VPQAAPRQRVHCLPNSATSGSPEAMESSMKSNLVFALTMLAVMTLLAGCGRKAGLDTPYEAAVEARKEAEKAKQPLPPEPTPPDKNRPFVLDPLIQ